MVLCCPLVCGHLFALLCPVTAALFYFGATPFFPSDLWLPAILAFAAGAFICIALGDLLPEVQFHSHDRLRLTCLFLLGVGVAYALGWFEPATDAGYWGAPSSRAS